MSLSRYLPSRWAFHLLSIESRSMNWALSRMKSREVFRDWIDWTAACFMIGTYTKRLLKQKGIPFLRCLIKAEQQTKIFEGRGGSQPSNSRWPKGAARGRWGKRRRPGNEFEQTTL